jgi:hypothetical protein
VEGAHLPHDGLGEILAWVGAAYHRPRPLMPRQTLPLRARVDIRRRTRTGRYTRRKGIRNWVNVNMRVPIPMGLAWAVYETIDAPASGL